MRAGDDVLIARLLGFVLGSLKKDRFLKHMQFSVSVPLPLGPQLGGCPYLSCAAWLACPLADGCTLTLLAVESFPRHAFEDIKDMSNHEKHQA